MRKPRRTVDWKEYELVKKYSDSEEKLKSFSKEGHLKVALIYPNSYRILSGNLGFQRVFEIANSVSGISCERFFYDEKFNRFYSLDSLRPLDEFKVWMFSISYELDFFNLVDILKKLKVPVLADERKEVHPFVLIGGPLVTINPELFYHIADLIYHGEAEVELKNVLNEISKHLTDGKKVVFEVLRDISTVTVPSLNKKAVGEAIYREVINDPAGSIFLTKYGEFKDSFLIEIGRGCFRKCKFCTIGNLYGYFRPVKVSAVKEKLERALALLKDTRDFKVGLIAPAVNDHPKFEEILDYLEYRNIRFSVSSLRADTINEKLLRGLLRSGQNMLTIAPETGSEKLRTFLNKKISNELIYDKISLAKNLGFKKIKLYMMFGLPDETEEDLIESAKMIEKVSNMGFNEVVVSVSPFVPKPRTSFENLSFQNIKILNEKQKVLKVRLKNVKVNIGSFRESFIQYKLDHLDSQNILLLLKVLEERGKSEALNFIKNL